MDEALSKAIDAIDDQDCDAVRLICAKCRGLMHGYHARWKDQSYITTAVEQTLSAPLINPDTMRSSRNFRLGGKLDIQCIEPGMHADRNVIIDHKSTSEPIHDPAAPYWQQLRVDQQSSNYALLAWQHGIAVDDIVWDVMRKPTIGPAKLKSKAAVKLVLETKSYCGVELPEESLQHIEKTGREDLRAYEARLADDCTNVRPDFYFQRQSIMRCDHELVEHAKQLWQIQKSIGESISKNRHLQNPKACMLYGSPCKFLGICSGHDSPDGYRWQEKEQVHNELDLAGTDGRDLLTTSRMTSYLTCQRKHYYEYVLGLQRFDSEEKESLVFGTIWHIGLEAWWSCFAEEELIHG